MNLQRGLQFKAVELSYDRISFKELLKTLIVTVVTDLQRCAEVQT